MKIYNKIICTNGHDRCFEGADESCPYCEKYQAKAKILIGLPGSGKSTWADKQKGFVIISRDVIVEELAKENNLTYTQAFDKINQDETSKEFFRRLRRAVNNDDNIIVDQTHMGSKRRSDVIKILDGYDLEAVVFVVSVPELTRRLKEREIKTGKHIPEYVVNNMVKAYQSPTKDEGFNKITYVRA